MKAKRLGGAAAVIVAGIGTAWFLTAPSPLSDDVIAGMTGDPEKGALVFAAGGCASCHIAKGADDGSLVLSGGQTFETEFGTFYAPNISSDPVHGIGAWDTLDLVNAVKQGVSPEGQHYYPAFPYGSYTRASTQDIVDLAAYMQTLPASDIPSQDHELIFPFNIRRSVGGWKLLFFSDDWVVDGDLTEQQMRGRELAEGLAHCAECHTSRNAMGGLQTSRWMGGAPNPSGSGQIPNITPSALGWLEFDITEYLTSGFTPEFDTAGGEMAHVVKNMAQLPQEDREAIAAYIAMLPDVE